MKLGLVYAIQYTKQYLNHTREGMCVFNLFPMFKTKLYSLAPNLFIEINYNIAVKYTAIETLSTSRHRDIDYAVVFYERSQGVTAKV